MMRSAVQPLLGPPGYPFKSSTLSNKTELFLMQKNTGISHTGCSIASSSPFLFRVPNHKAHFTFFQVRGAEFRAERKVLVLALLGTRRGFPKPKHQTCQCVYPNMYMLFSVKFFQLFLLLPFVLSWLLITGCDRKGEGIGAVFRLCKTHSSPSYFVVPCQ